MGWLDRRFGKRMGVYALINRMNGKVYVGSSTDLKKRAHDHLYLLRHDQHPNPHLQYAFNKYGEEAFEMRILQEVTSQDDLLAVEQYWLDYTQCYDHQHGYNIDPSAERNFISDETRAKIGVGNSGKTRSAEVRAKISAALKGRPLPEETRKKMMGRTHSEEAREKIAKAGKGRVVSEETRAKISAALKGRGRSDEHRAKLSQALKGRPLSDETRAKMRGRTHTEETCVKIATAGRRRVVSEETRAKMSAAHKRRTLSEEARAKVIQALTGRPVSKETRAKISAARRANPLSEESRRRIVEAKRVLTPDQVQEIRKRLARGEAIRSIAEAYGVNYYTVWNILKGRTWAHLPPPDE